MLRRIELPTVASQMIYKKCIVLYAAMNSSSQDKAQMKSYLASQSMTRASTYLLFGQNIINIKQLISTLSNRPCIITSSIKDLCIQQLASTRATSAGRLVAPLPTLSGEVAVGKQGAFAACTLQNLLIHSGTDEVLFASTLGGRNVRGNAPTAYCVL